MVGRGGRTAVAGPREWALAHQRRAGFETDSLKLITDWASVVAYLERRTAELWATDGRPLRGLKPPLTHQAKFFLIIGGHIKNHFNRIERVFSQISKYSLVL